VKKKIVIAAGGTGGHLFPAQALAQKIVEADPEIEIYFLASHLSSNPNFQRTFAFVDIVSSTLGKNPLMWPFALAKLFWGTLEALYVLARLKADLVIGFGSFHTAPVLAAARRLKIPYILHESNAIPGKVTKLFSKKAKWCGCFFKSAAAMLGPTSRMVNVPLRDQFQKDKMASCQDARLHYGLDPEKMTLLIFGGSQGAKKINELMVQNLAVIPADFQIIHFTGLNKAESIAECYKKAKISAFVAEFEPEMAYAWAAADLAICRAGAGAIAESLSCQVPCLFIPYPFAYNHQETNARNLVAESQCGSVICERELQGDAFEKKLKILLNKEQIRSMKHNLSAYVEHSDMLDFYTEVMHELEGGKDERKDS